MTETFVVPKMACKNCFNTIKAVLSKALGVSELTCDLEMKSVTVAFDEKVISADEIKTKLSKLGFPAEKIQ